MNISLWIFIPICLLAFFGLMFSIIMITQAIEDSLKHSAKPNKKKGGRIKQWM